MNVLMGGLFWTFGRIMRSMHGPSASTPTFMEFLGGASILLGILWMLLRQRRTLDGRTLDLTDWSCLGWFTPGAVTRLAEVEAVVIDRVSRVLQNQRSGMSHVEDVDRVWLDYRAGERLLLDSFPNRPFEAQRTAEGTSRLLGVEFRDLTRCPPQIRKSSELDESLGQRYLRTAQPLPRPQEPPILWFRCLEDPGGLEVRIPRAGLADPRKPVLAALGFGLAGALLAVLLMEGDWKAALPICISASFAFAIPPIWTSWQAARLTESLRLTPRSLRVESTLYGRHEIPLGELEDLALRDFRQNQGQRGLQTERFFPVGCLWARSDRVEACFGGGLDEANLEYLRALLVNRIVEYTRST